MNGTVMKTAWFGGGGDTESACYGCFELIETGRNTLHAMLRP